MLCVAAVLGGCGIQGDFGRENPSRLFQRVGLDKYSHVPDYANEPGRIRFTPAETELRLHAYALTRTFAHQKTHGHFAEFDPFVPRAVEAVFKPQVTAVGYAAEIDAAGYQSPEARLNAIIDDIRTDGRHIDAFWVAAVDVYRDDERRFAEIERGNLPPDVVTDLARRIEENRAILDITVFALGERLEGYRIALSRGYAAAPTNAYAGAWVEFENYKRIVQRVASDTDNLGRTHSLALPRSDGCVVRSLARPC